MNDFENCIHFSKFTPQKSKFIRKNKYVYYSTDIIYLDTETSHNHMNDKKYMQGWVYQWCFFYQDKYIYGRNVEDLVNCLYNISIKYTQRYKTVIYVHNLSYDIQYLKNALYRKMGDFKILATDFHKFITFTIRNLEFRCTYRLSGRSLEKWCKDLKVDTPKLKDYIDYDTIRYNNTPLTKNEWKYMIRDVRALKECLEKTMVMYGDNISTIPLTITSYVRREARNRFNQNFANNRQLFTDTALNYETYTILRNAFSGALTHGNRFYANKIISGNIKHRDFRSHYPTQQICKYFPVGKFNRIGTNLSFNDLRKYIDDYCVIMQVTFENIELKNKKTAFPYLQVSKVQKGRIGHIDIVEDNGRILLCKGIFTMCMTEIDYKIINKYYKWNKHLVNIAYASVKGKIPNYLIDLINHFFYKKSNLKDLYSATGNDDDYINLMISKTMLNGIYGMSATDIVRDELELSCDGKWSKTLNTKYDIECKLLDYYDNKNNCIPYQYGVYTTAHARSELMEMYEVVGDKNFLYSDTDSMFYISNEEIERKFDSLNSKYYYECIANNWYITKDNGEVVTYHAFDDEKENIVDFKFLHSKCYGYNIVDDGKRSLKIIVAGVPKSTNGITRERELGGLNNLSHNFTFKINGGTRCVYVEDYDSSAIILKTEKTLKHEIDSDLMFYMEE